MTSCQDPSGEVTIRDLYPHLSDEELRQAEENLRRYLETGWDMYERIRADPEVYAQFKLLTAKMRNPTIENKEFIPPDYPHQST